MTHAARAHRLLDRQFNQATDGAPGHALVASRNRMRDQRTMASTRVLLTTLSVRTSAKGRPYLSGFLGKARVVAFEGEADRFGNATWDIFVASPEPRDGQSAPARSAQTSDRDPARASEPASDGARPGASHRAPRRESEKARQERISGEVARHYGVASDADLDDAIPF